MEVGSHGMSVCDFYLPIWIWGAKDRLISGKFLNLVWIIYFMSSLGVKLSADYQFAKLENSQKLANQVG